MPDHRSLDAAPSWQGSTLSYLSPRLLQPVVDTGRLVFDAAACSILTLDAEVDRLVFGAVAGEGAEHLVGRSVPLDTGIAGWVFQAQEPIRVDSLKDSAVFARETAEQTGYVPSRLAAAPLVIDGSTCIGVLEVLDWGRLAIAAGESLTVLQSMASQAAVALSFIIGLSVHRNAVESRELSELVDHLRATLGGLDPAELARKSGQLRAIMALV